MPDEPSDWKKKVKDVLTTVAVIAAAGFVGVRLRHEWVRDDRPAPAVTQAKSEGGQTSPDESVRLVGRWTKDGGGPLVFTRGGSVLARGYAEQVAKYKFDGESLTIFDDANHKKGTAYSAELESDTSLLLGQDVNRNGLFGVFSVLTGRWRRESPPPGSDVNSPGTGPVADAKRQVERIEQKRAKLERLLKDARSDRDDLVTKLRAVGVETTADLKGNVRGQRLAEGIARIATEIDGMERQLASLDAELLKAREITRRMEREQAGLSDDEMRKLAEQLREVEERRDGPASAPRMPLDVDAAVENALQAGRNSPSSKEPK